MSFWCAKIYTRHADTCEPAQNPTKPSLRFPVTSFQSVLSIRSLPFVHNSRAGSLCWNRNQQNFEPPSSKTPTTAIPTIKTTSTVATSTYSISSSVLWFAMTSKAYSRHDRSHLRRKEKNPVLQRSMVHYTKESPIR